SPGSAFGLAVESSQDQIHFAAVDDNLNTLDIWTINLQGDPSRMRQQAGAISATSSAALRGPDLFAKLPVATATAQTPTMLAVLDATLVDQLFAAAGKADQPLSFAIHSARVHVVLESNWL